MPKKDVMKCSDTPSQTGKAISVVIGWYIDFLFFFFFSFLLDFVQVFLSFSFQVQKRKETFIYCGVQVVYREEKKFFTHKKKE